MFKLVLEKPEEPEIKLPTSAGIMEKASEFQKNIYIGFIDYARAFDCVDHNKLWKILTDIGILDTWPASWEICMQVRKQQNWTWNNRLVPQEKEYIKAVYCHPAYLTSMQSTSWEMLGWMKHSWYQDCWEKYQ